MLDQLDPLVVSKFAGEYFDAVADQPLQATRADHKLSEHEAVCEALARFGLSDAQPSLERLAVARGESTGDKPPYATAASLAIAARDPWPAVDPWLAKMARAPLAWNRGAGQEIDLSALAAAILLERHGENFAEFQLERIFPPNANDPFDGRREDENPFGRALFYRFTNPSGREQVARWWQEIQLRATAAPNAAG